MAYIDIQNLNAAQNFIQNLDFTSDEIDQIYNFIESLDIKQFKFLISLIQQLVQGNEDNTADEIFEFCNGKLNRNITAKLQIEIINHPKIIGLLQDIYLDNFLE
ncbi:MAG: hypothetical protein ACTSRZ_02020 [Promethearchaeota archaeon]